MLIFDHAWQVLRICVHAHTQVSLEEAYAKAKTKSNVSTNSCNSSPLSNIVHSAKREK